MKIEKFETNKILKTANLGSVVNNVELHDIF